MNYILSLTSLSLNFGDKTIFRDISFTTHSGDITIIKGKNGSGKTCLLQSICGIIPKHFAGDLSGEITINHSPLPHYPTSEHRTPKTEHQTPLSLFSLLMQDPDRQLCFPRIEEELYFGAENIKRDKEAFYRDYEMLLDIFHFLRDETKETYSLSFGQKKALLLSGMILKDASIYLLDEPSAGLSQDIRDRFAELILLLSQRNKIIIIAEHLPHYDDLATQIINL